MMERERKRARSRCNRSNFATETLAMWKEIDSQLDLLEDGDKRVRKIPAKGSKKGLFLQHKSEMREGTIDLLLENCCSYMIDVEDLLQQMDDDLHDKPAEQRLDLNDHPASGEEQLPYGSNSAPFFQLQSSDSDPHLAFGEELFPFGSHSAPYFQMQDLDEQLLGSLEHLEQASATIECHLGAKESKLEDSTTDCEYDFEDGKVSSVEALMNIMESEVGEKTTDLLLENYFSSMIYVEDLMQQLDSEQASTTIHYSFGAKESTLEDLKTDCDYDFGEDGTVSSLEALMNMMELEVTEETNDLLLENYCSFMFDVEDLMQLMDDDKSRLQRPHLDDHPTFEQEQLKCGSHSAPFFQLHNPDLDHHPAYGGEQCSCWSHSAPTLQMPDLDGKSLNSSCHLEQDDWLDFGVCNDQDPVDKGLFNSFDVSGKHCKLDTTYKDLFNSFSESSTENGKDVSLFSYDLK